MIIRIRKRLIAAVCAAALVFSVFIAAQERGQDGSTVEMPAIMYHLINEDSSQSGKYVITPARFESDMQYLCDNGYTAVTVGQLLDFAENGTPLPDKPVLITFDDGYESFYVYAFPVLKKLGMSAVLSVIGTYSELYSNCEDHNVKYSHCTWEHIAEMAQSGAVDIGNHTWDLHTLDKRKGCAIIRGENVEQYSEMLVSDVSKLQDKLEEVTGTAPVLFTYPFGRCCSEAADTIDKMGFKITLGCEEKINRLTPNDPDCLKKIRRFNRDGRLTTQEFFKKIL
jgi:peptidoglycan/xylan/chitin deacetylase (PgdA/CDA1 family)